MKGLAKMSLEVFGDEGNEGISSENLENAGWWSSEDGKIWYKYPDEPHTFEEACASVEDDISSFLEGDIISSFLED